MKKSITTRFRVTKKGKAVHRKIAQCHFRAKRTSGEQKRKDGTVNAHYSTIRRIIKKPGTL
jgi:ribosomal protein L35